jgi:NTF2-related export protein 1/2
MLLTVNGIVTHHTPGSSSVVSGASAPSSNAPRSAKEAHAEQVPYEALPRAFSQSFVLISDLQRDGGIAAVEADMHARYFVQADQFRFVG